MNGRQEIARQMLIDELVSFSAVRGLHQRIKSVIIIKNTSVMISRQKKGPSPAGYISKNTKLVCSIITWYTMIYKYTMQLDKGGASFDHVFLPIKCDHFPLLSNLVFSIAMQTFALGILYHFLTMTLAEVKVVVVFDAANSGLSTHKETYKG